MLKKDHNLAFIAKVFILLIYSVGLTGLSLPFLRDLFQQLTPLNLIVSTLILFFFHEKWNWQFILVLLTIVVVSIFAEGLGTNYGLLFGNYYYGETLGLKIWNVPFLIGLNWLMLTYSSFMLVKKLKWNRFLKIILAAVFLVGYDFLLEKPAGVLDMWNWEGHKIPLKNYITWFIFAFLFVYFLSWKKLSIKNPVAAFLLITQFVFFLLLNLTLGIWAF